MELCELAGKHVLSGIETGQVVRESLGFCTERHGYIKFTLDGVTYMAEEDPEDGWRSYMKDLTIVKEPCKIHLPNVAVVCRMRQDDGWEKTMFLFLLMPRTEKTSSQSGLEILTIIILIAFWSIRLKT